MAYSPTIVQHSPIEWYSQNITSAIRSSPLGTNSLNPVAFPNMPWTVLWLTVKPVVPSKLSHDITLKQCRDHNYFLPFPSDQHIHASTTSSTYLYYSAVSRWVSGSCVLDRCFSSGAVAGVVLQQLQLQRCEHKYLTDTTHKVLITKHLSKPHPTRALMSVSNSLFHHTCKNLLSVNLIQLHTNVVSALYSGVAGTHDSITHVLAKHFSTHTQLGYELFSTYGEEQAENFSTHALGAMNFSTPAANHFLHLCNCSSYC